MSIGCPYCDWASVKDWPDADTAYLDHCQVAHGHEMKRPPLGRSGVDLVPPVLVGLSGVDPVPPAFVKLGIDYGMFNSVPPDQIKIRVEHTGLASWAWRVDSGMSGESGHAFTRGLALAATSRAIRRLRVERAREQNVITWTEPFDEPPDHGV